MLKHQIKLLPFFFLKTEMLQSDATLNQRGRISVEKVMSFPASSPRLARVPVCILLLLYCFIVEGDS